MKAAKDFPLFYLDQGKAGGRVVIFLHAFPLDHTAWQAQMAALAPEFRTVAFDVRGLGQSELGSGQYTMETYVEDLVQLMDLLEIPQAVLCGLSLGGYIALRCFEKYPERVSALVLSNTRSEADNNQGKLNRAESIFLLQSQGVEAFTRGFVPKFTGKTTQEQHPEVTQKITRMILSQEAAGIVSAQLAMISRTDTGHVLPNIQVPTLVIGVEEDPLIPAEQSKALAEKIPGAEFALIPQAGHMSNLENPEKFNEALLKFLRKL